MTTSPYTCKIGGSFVSLIAGTLNVDNQIGQRSTGSIGVRSALGTVWQYGTSVQVFDPNNNLVYSGYVNKDTATKSGAKQGSGQLEHKITLMDNVYRADKRVAWKSYLGQTAGFIVSDLVNAYLSLEGVTYTAASVATGPTITEAIWNGKKISDAITWLAQQAGYWWQIDVNGVLWFQPYGGTPAPFTLDGTQIEAETVSVDYGNDMYVNSQYARGAFAEIGSKGAPLHETIYGDGVSKRAYTLANPVNTLYQLTQTISGVTTDVTSSAFSKGSIGGAWYYAKGDAVIAQDTSQTLLGASDHIDVYYTGRFPVIALATNPALITAQQTREGGGTGIVESVYVNTKVHTLTAAQSIAAALLSHYGTDTTALTFDTRSTGLAPGQMLTVNLSDFALSNKQMLISEVNLTDQQDGYNVWYHVTAIGSPIESVQWQTYWANLMLQSFDPSDLTDAVDTFLATLRDTVLVRTPTATVTRTDYTCPICSNALVCNTSSPVIC